MRSCLATEAGCGRAMSRPHSRTPLAASWSGQSPAAPGPDLPDAERNRLLRRADWRFLLPIAAPWKSICFAKGLLAEATAAVSDTCLPTCGTGESPDACDLAVAVDPDAVTLSRAWAALRPGGACYVEWNRGWRGPVGVRRRLETAGFEEVACYAPRPQPDRGAEVWVALDSDGAVQHFLSRHSRPRTGLRGLLQRLRDVLWRSSSTLRFAFPLCTVARRPRTSPVVPRAVRSPEAPKAAVRGLSPQLEQEMRSNWEAWGFGSPPGELSALLVTRGRRSINKAVALVFAEGDVQPRVVVKRARVLGAAQPMLNEAQVLRAVQARQGGTRGAPSALFCRELDGLLTLAETFVDGRPMAEMLGPENCRALALQATDWSAELAQVAHAVPQEVWWGRLIEPVVSDFEYTFGPVLDRGALRAALDVLSSLGPLPLVCEQRDFSPWNLIVAPSGELGVLDWESAERQGLPALDLIYCLMYLSASLDGSGHLWEARRRCSEPGTAMGSIAEECLGRYLHHVGVPRAALHPLAVLAWMIHAKSDYKHFCLDLGQPPAAALLRRSVFLRLWYQELEGRWT
jgi:hypothetical protein